MPESSSAPVTFWVFGYGSLMWDSWEEEFACGKRTVATLPGYRRSFDKLSQKNWGTKENPCPTLNLHEEPSASCTGMAFGFAESERAQVLDYLGKREGKGFQFKPLVIRFADGTKTEASAPLYAGKNRLADPTLEQQVRMFCAAAGDKGTGVDYVKGIAGKLDALGIHDPAVRVLQVALRAL